MASLKVWKNIHRFALLDQRVYICMYVNFFFILLLLWLIHVTSFQDEAGIFSALFHIGRNHGKFVVSIINKVSEEVRMLLLNPLLR
jgi:hypothetical protein